MFFKNTKNNLLELNNAQLKELEWAHIYHDSIRGKKWLQDLPINVGRWAGNYSFFYVLSRILAEYYPKSIIEFGLGESSKMISTYIDNYLKESQHLIIEQSQEWADAFNTNFRLSDNSKIKVFNMLVKQVKGKYTNGYEGIEKLKNEKFDLYIVDGPFGSKNYSRYDIVSLVSTLTSDDEFIIIIDDYQRKGEQQTTEDIDEIFKSKNICIHKKVYEGNKSSIVLATNKYKFAASF